jgi:hypothetical protein
MTPALSIGAICGVVLTRYYINTLIKRMQVRMAGKMLDALRAGA